MKMLHKNIVPSGVRTVVLKNRKVFDVNRDTFEINDEADTYSFEYEENGWTHRITVRSEAVDALVERVR